MNILMSIRKPWTDMILNGSKTLEFRNNIGNNFETGSIVYVYESKSNKGLGKVVGEFKIKEIVNISKSKAGAYPFLLYYAENILKDKESVKAIEKIYDIELNNYDDSFKLYYIFNPEALEMIEKTDKSIDFLSMTKDEYSKYKEKEEKSMKIWKDCDEWLKYIGFYNDYGESNYKNYIEIYNYVKYDKPLELNNFKNQKGEIISRAPQSWCYTI